MANTDTYSAVIVTSYSSVTKIVTTNTVNRIQPCVPAKEILRNEKGLLFPSVMRMSKKYFRFVYYVGHEDVA